MKRISLWLLSTLTVVVLLFGYDGSASTTISAPPAAISPGTSATGEGSSGGSGGASSTGSSRSRTNGTRTVTGGVATTQWGPVQLELTITGSTISKVSVLQQPSGNSRDEEINAYALPILIEETTSAQSANIDMVSGATVTSAGYLQSLQSAIDQAGL